MTSLHGGRRHPVMGIKHPLPTHPLIAGLMTDSINPSGMAVNTTHSDSSPNIGVTGGRSFKVKAGAPARAALRLFHKLFEKAHDLFARLIRTWNKTPRRAHTEESPTGTVAGSSMGKDQHSGMTAIGPAVMRSRRASTSGVPGLTTAQAVKGTAENRRNTTVFTGVIAAHSGDAAAAERASIVSLSSMESSASIELPISDAMRADTRVGVVPPAPPLPAGGLNLKSATPDPLAALRERKRQNAGPDGAAGSAAAKAKAAHKPMQSIMDDAVFLAKLKARLAKLDPQDESDGDLEKMTSPPASPSMTESHDLINTAVPAVAATLKASRPPPAPALPAGGLDLRPSATDPLAALRAHKRAATGAKGGSAPASPADAAKSFLDDKEFQRRLAIRRASLEGG